MDNQNILYKIPNIFSKSKHGIILVLLLSLLTIQCSDNDDKIDDEKPSIDLTAADAFPKNCDTLHIGETFHFRALFTDNMELGSFNLDIHHNFDHHSHSTEVTECQLSPEKEPVNPWLFIKEYDIADGLKEYQADITITVPDDVDPGDYHFMVKVTDAEGWEALKGLSIKLKEKGH